MKLAQAVIDGRTRVVRICTEHAYQLSGIDSMLQLIENHSWREVADAALSCEPLPIHGLHLLSPLKPRQLIGIGANYHGHVEEAHETVPGAPLAFGKLPSSIAGPGEPIRLCPAVSTEVDYEAELAIILGSRIGSPLSHYVSDEDVLSSVFGYTCANDVSARDLQRSDGQWMRAKSLPSFTPLGPWLVTADDILDPEAIEVRGTLNGEIVQQAKTSMMIHSIPSILRFLLSQLTLWPGDVILSGTPSGVGGFRNPPRYLRDGDVFSVEIDHIGTLTNPVRVAPVS